jgi:hypothetical protein
MLNYHFSMRDNRTESENLGSHTFGDDAEALAFGGSVIRDLMYGEDKRYADWIMDIGEGERTVGSIRFDASTDYKK